MPHPLSLFKFCPRCGSAQFAVSDGRPKRCADCGFTYYHNASASTVAVIFNARGELLTARRALEPARGTLDLPGGFVDPGETLEEGCRREVREETGGEVSALRYLFSLTNVYRFSGFDVHTTDAFFLCRLADDAALAAADDADALRWLPAADVRPEEFGLASIRLGVERLIREGMLPVL